MAEEQYSYVSKAKRRYYVLLAVLWIICIVQAITIVARDLAVFGAYHKAVEYSVLAVLGAVIVMLGLMIRSELRYINTTMFDMALRDELTDLYNRRYFLERLSEEMSRARRTGSNLGVVLADADGLKDINDRFGHSAGDQFLKTIAVSLKNKVRQYDVVARWGGDEFAILMPGISKDQVPDLWQRLMMPISSDGYVSDDKEPWTRATLSVGVAIYPEDGDTPEAILSSADHDLYKTKGYR